MPAQAVNDLGQSIDLKTPGASTLTELVSASHERLLWHEASRHPGLEHLCAGGALIGVKKVLQRKRASNHMAQEVSSATDALLGSLWPVAQRASLDRPLAASPTCPMGAPRARRWTWPP